MNVNVNENTENLSVARAELALLNLTDEYEQNKARVLKSLLKHAADHERAADAHKQEFEAAAKIIEKYDPGRYSMPDVTSPKFVLTRPVTKLFRSWRAWSIGLSVLIISYGAVFFHGN